MAGNPRHNLGGQGTAALYPQTNLTALGKQFPLDRLVKYCDLSEMNEAITVVKRGSAIKPVLRISEV